MRICVALPFIFSCALLATEVVLALGEVDLVTPELVQRLREALLLDREDRIKNAEDAKEIVSSVVFREIGRMSGSTTFGHLVFTTDLSGIDDALIEHDQNVKKWTEGAQDSWGKKFMLSVSREIARIRRVKERWQNLRAIFGVRPEKMRVPGEGEAPTTAPLRRHKRLVPLLIPLAILGGAAVLGTSLGVFSE
jgi:hypothetical protein